MTTHRTTTRLAGIDLAWQSERNPSAIAIGNLIGRELILDRVFPSVVGFSNVLGCLRDSELKGIAIDAPLIIRNITGQRACETQVGRLYGARGASCHTSNLQRFPDAASVRLSDALSEEGFKHLGTGSWQIECYPHPALIEIFDLPERLAYKRGSVVAKRTGQIILANMLISLEQNCIIKLTLGAEHLAFLDEARIIELKGKELKQNEDALDAIVWLYIAALYQIGGSGITTGTLEDGYIWIPTRPVG